MILLNPKKHTRCYPDKKSREIIPIFDLLGRDFSKNALQLYSKPSSTPKEMDLGMKMIMRPLPDAARFERVWKDHVFALAGAYRMND